MLRSNCNFINSVLSESPQGVEILSVTINHVHRNPTDSREDEIISLSANYEELILQNADVVRSICMEDEIQTMMQKTRENQLLEYQATQLRINMHKVQLNDEMCKVKKSATEVREESRVRIQNISARKEYEIQQIKDKAVSEAYCMPQQINIMLLTSFQFYRVHLLEILIKCRPVILLHLR